MMKRTLLTLSLLAPSAPLLAGGVELQPLREIAIQDGGRTKPLDSFARDLAKRVQGARPFGLDRIEGLEPSEWLLSLLAKPDEWRDRPIIKVTHAGLREAAALDGPGTAWLYQFSPGSPATEVALGLRGPLVLGYHNVTPAACFAGWSSEVARLAHVVDALGGHLRARDELTQDEGREVVGATSVG